MKKQQIGYGDFDGFYSSAEDFYKVVKSKFDALQSQYSDVELEISSDRYEGISMTFYGDSIAEKEEKDRLERAEYERLKAKFG